jgi:large subunit ribosomal protein L25
MRLIIMTTLFTVEAKTRADVGRGASRRLRHADQLPAIIYGAGKEPVSLILSHNEMMKRLRNEAFYSHILTIEIDGKKEQAVLKALQRHPVKPRLLHADFLRVKAGEAIHMKVPFHFIGEENCPGVAAGGLVTHLITSVEISCMPKDLPEFIEVDLSALELDQTIHLFDVKLPHGVKYLHDDAEHNQPIVSVHIPKASKEDLEAEAAEAALAAEMHAVAETEHAAEEPAAEAAAPEGEAAKPEGEA